MKHRLRQVKARNADLVRRGPGSAPCVFGGCVRQRFAVGSVWMLCLSSSLVAQTGSMNLIAAGWPIPPSALEVVVRATAQRHDVAGPLALPIPHRPAPWLADMAVVVDDSNGSVIYYNPARLSRLEPE